MRILMVNKFHYIKGGSETYYFALKKLLESKGHTVIDFSMDDEKNFESQYSGYFVGKVDYNSEQGMLAKIKQAKNIVYSSEAKKKFEELVIATKPDLIHLHLFQHQISPSILDVIKKHNIPTVYTAHELKMICPNYKMMHQGVLCEECKSGQYYKCAKNKCVKDSFLKSFINVIEAYFHKWKKSYDVIGTVITPSAFYKKKFEEFGVDANRVLHIPNFLDKQMSTSGRNEEAKEYYLYFGRLSEEKGILTLIKAVENIDVELYIVGTGPLEQEIKSYLDNLKTGNVHLLGFKSGQELVDIVGNAKAIVLPSEWYENGPYSAIEALQLGRPIIGADIGGIPELVDNNGFLFESGNVDSLKEAILNMENMDQNEYDKLVSASTNLFQKNHTPDVHYEMLKKAYKKVGIDI